MSTGLIITLSPVFRPRRLVSISVLTAQEGQQLDTALGEVPPLRAPFGANLATARRAPLFPRNGTWFYPPDEVLALWEKGELRVEPSDEDCHTAIEGFITKKYGEESTRFSQAVEGGFPWAEMETAAVFVGLNISVEQS